jgi:hypothetical protein
MSGGVGSVLCGDREQTAFPSETESMLL